MNIQHESDSRLLLVTLQRFNHYFAKKNNRSNYIISKVYHSIVLLNIMKKILKSIMTIRFNYAAEKHDLLFKKYFKSRKSTFSKHALHYLMKFIHFVWINKKIAFLLLLNVINVFDNVFHFKLLYNLRKRRIKNFFSIWIKNFLSKKHTTMKMINHITRQMRTWYEVS